jgi:hypothetical protein
MGINWLMMAGLGRKVTGLSWTLFTMAQTPGMVVAVLMGAAVALTAHGTRSVHHGGFVVLVVAARTVALIAQAIRRLRPARARGPHGAWAIATIDGLVRRRPRRGGGPRRPATDGVAG